MLLGSENITFGIGAHEEGRRRKRHSSGGSSIAGAAAEEMRAVLERGNDDLLDNDEHPPSTWKEIRLLIELAIPTIIVQLGAVVPPFMTASYVGRNFGAVYLDGFQLANLTGNLFTLSLCQGLYSASDTLSPQAYGAGNFKEVGLIAVRGFLGSILLMTPICLFLFVYLEPAMIWFGEDPLASIQAGRWYGIYVASLPFYALYNVTWKFLSAQNVMTPLLLSTAVSCLLVLPLALELGVRWFGFLGSAMAVVMFQVSQASVVLLYLWWFRPHHLETWPPTMWQSIGQALEYKSLRLYFYLGLGGIVAS